MENKKSDDEVREFNFGRLFLGIVILAIGLFYLGRGTGIIPAGYNINIWQLWPVLIIYIGLSMLRSRGWFGTAIGIIGTILILIAVGISMFAGNVISVGSTQVIKNIPINIAKDASAQSANINIKTGVGNVKIAGGANGLIEGNLQSNFLEITQSSTVGNGVQAASLETTGGMAWNWMSGGRFVNELDLKINSDMPVSLNLNSGVSSISADFSGIQLEQANITSGMSSVDIILGDKVQNSSLKIDAGLSSIKIHIPQNVGAKLRVSGGMNSRTLDKFTSVDENNFISDNYNSSNSTVNIETNGGMSSLQIDWR